MEANLPLPQNSEGPDAASATITAQSSEDASAASTTITAQQIYCNDPLTVLLRDRLRMNNLAIFILLLAITLGCFYGLYTLPGVSAKLVNQTAFALLETFTASLFYIAYIWLPNAISFLFNSLKENEVLDHAVHSQYQASYERFCKSFLSWMNHKAWWMVSVVFILLYLLNRYLVDGPPFIEHVPVWLQFVTAVLDGFIAYCVFMSIIRFVISIFFVNLLFRSFTIHVHPLHPDRSGGLGVMRRILWVTVAIILGTTLVFYNTIQISVANNIPSSMLDNIMLAVAYLILAPSLLMGWLALPHYLMLKARQAVLQPLVEEFHQVAANSVSVTQEETAQILADTDRLSAIKRRYDLLSATFPTWPVEIAQVRGIIAALSIPALISLLPYIADVLKFLGALLSK